MREYQQLMCGLLGLYALSGCTMVTPGSQSHLPLVQAQVDTPTRVAPGQTVYVQYNYGGGVLKVPAARFDALKINFDSASQNNDKVVGPEADADWLRMNASNLPQGLSVRLVKATIAKQVSNTDVKEYRINVSYSEVIKVVLEVKAEAKALIGKKIVNLEFWDDPKSKGNVPLAINIVK